MANELVHKAVELKKVKVARRKVLSEPGYLERNYIALRKYDGCCAIITVNTMSGIDGAFDTWEDSVKITSRTGEVVRSMDHIRKAIFNHWKKQQFSGGAVIFAEAWIPNVAEGTDFAYISGKFRQHAPCEDLQIIAWDTVSSAEYQSGKSYRGFLERFYSLSRLLPDGDFGIHTSQYYTPGSYSNAQALCDHLVSLGGYDGLVLKDPVGSWVKGPGTGGESIKVKQKLSFDLRVVGLEEGEGKHAGRTGRLLVNFFGKVLGVGTGLSDAQRADWWAGRGDIVGQIVEVEAMARSNDGLLREPRLKGVRYDKLVADDEQG